MAAKRAPGIEAWTVAHRLVASAWAWAIGSVMLPVVSTATMMSARAGRPSSASVLFTVVDVPATSVAVTGVGVSVSAAATGIAATSHRMLAAAAAAKRAGFWVKGTIRTPLGTGSFVPTVRPPGALSAVAVDVPDVPIPPRSVIASTARLSRRFGPRGTVLRFNEDPAKGYFEARDLRRPMSFLTESGHFTCQD